MLQVSFLISKETKGTAGNEAQVLATCVFNEKQIKFSLGFHATPLDNTAFQSTLVSWRTLNFYSNA